MIAKAIPSTARVLVVDDNAAVRQGIVALLMTVPDIQVVGEATDGAEAVDLARALAPDVVLMDVAMPNVDGREATRRIRAEMPGVRVIALSAYRPEDIGDSMSSAGAVAHVSKDDPCDAVIAAVRLASRHLVLP